MKFITDIMKSLRVVAASFLMMFSLLVAADCEQNCTDEYDECMATATSNTAIKTCASILRECKLECQM
jgi:hypothetical protein